MRNLKLTLEYDGTDFHGFQRQRRLRTVQGVLEERFSRLLGEDVHVVGAGRTDAGVHATGQVANFRTSRPIGLDRLVRVLNAALPGDVKVQACEEMDEGFHARRRARSRTYRYAVVQRDAPSPLVGRFALVMCEPLDLAAMAKAARPLVGRHDFSAYQAAGSETATTERTLMRLDCLQAGSRVEVTAQADSFLYHMVRLLVAGLIRVGRAELKPEALAEALERRQRLPKCAPAPACGLCLVQVSY